MDSYEKIILDTSGYMDSKQLCKDEEEFCNNNKMYMEFGRDEETADKYARIINNWFAERYRKNIEITITRSENYLSEQGSNLIGHLVRTIRQLNLGSDTYLDECCSSHCCFDTGNVYESCNNFLDKEDLIESNFLLGQNVWPVQGFENAVKKKLNKFEQEMRMKIFRRHWPNLSGWLEEQYAELSQFVNKYGGKKTRDLHKKYEDLEQERFLLDQCLKVLNDCESDINHNLFQWHEKNK